MKMRSKSVVNRLVAVILYGLLVFYAGLADSWPSKVWLRRLWLQLSPHRLLPLAFVNGSGINVSANI
jgi:hypothetical protein